MLRYAASFALLVAPMSMLAAQQQRTLISDPRTGSVTVVVDTTGDALPIPLAPPVAYMHLLEVYRELGVTIEVADPVRREVGNQNFWKMRRLGGKPLSTYFGCGDSMTGANADSYRVYMSLLTRVTPGDGPEESRIRTAVQAVAANVMEGARDRIPCLSTGLLESRIRTMVMVRSLSRTPGDS